MKDTKKISHGKAATVAGGELPKLEVGILKATDVVGGFVTSPYKQANEMLLGKSSLGDGTHQRIACRGTTRREDQMAEEKGRKRKNSRITRCEEGVLGISEARLIKAKVGNIFESSRSPALLEPAHRTGRELLIQRSSSGRSAKGDPGQGHGKRFPFLGRGNPLRRGKERKASRCSEGKKKKN